MSDDLKRKIYKLKRKSTMNITAVEFLKGSIYFAEDNYKKSLIHLQRAENLGFINPDLHLKIGDIYLQLIKVQKAKFCFQRTLELDSNNAEAFLGLSKCFLLEKDYENAAQNALTCIGYKYYFPRAHYTLAVALHKLERIDSSIKALETALFQNPQFPAAYELLAEIYTQHKNDQQKADTFRKKATQSKEYIEKIKHSPISENIQKSVSQDNILLSFLDFNKQSYQTMSKNELFETVIVVTGIPRSGTSMIMQMLQAGGLPLLTDHKRPKDQNNPKGYFEFEPVKYIYRDNSFLEKAKGKGIKIIPQLLKHLNKHLSYRIIFIIRDLDEVINSQQLMLEKENKKGASLSKESLKSTYLEQLENIQGFLKNNVKNPVHVIEHQHCIKNPYETAKNLNLFMGEMFDADKMAEIVSNKLYRQRNKDL